MLDKSLAAEAAPASDRGGFGRYAWLWRVVLSNLPFVLALGFIQHLPQFVQVLVVGAVMFLSPGLAWSDRRAGDAFVVLFRAVAASLILSVIAWLALMALPGPTSREGFILALAAATNLGLWFGLRRGWYTADPFGTPISRFLMVAAAVFFLQSYAGAAYFVPPLEDQDIETQGTAYGLMHDFSPMMVTNRNTSHFFAHPLLLHFWIGESALVSNDLDRLKYYHDSAVAVGPSREDAKAQWNEDIAHLLRDTGSSSLGERLAQFKTDIAHFLRDPGGPIEEVRQAQWEKDYAQFMRDPVLVPSRTPNLFLSAFIMFPLGMLTFRLTGSRVAMLGVCLVYATFPEVYVRSSYGGYLAITNFLLTSGAYFYLRSAGLLPGAGGTEVAIPRARRLTFGTGFLLGISDQKGILVPLAAPVHAGLRVLLDGGLKDIFARLPKVLARPEVLAALLIGLGFVAGEFAYAIYGLGVAPRDFTKDYLCTHFVCRLRMNAVDFEASTTWYPSILALWKQFGDHSGWLFLAPAVLAMGRAATRMRQADGLLFLWVLIGAVGFSLVDWRQTKHLAHFLPALVMLTGILWASRRGWTQHALSAVLAVAVAWNIWRIGLLMNDFEYLKPLPIW